MVVRLLVRRSEGSQCGVRAGSGFEDMGQTGVQVDLNEDGNSKDRNHNGLRQKLFALEAEEQHQCRQQSHQGERLEVTESADRAHHHHEL